jgi:hypothetical protein
LSAIEATAPRGKRPTMTKLFHFDCPREVYQADACVITCFDARFDLAIRKFLGRQGIGIYDQIKIPGSAKALAAPAGSSERDLVLGMVRTSMRLHRPARLWLFAHADCGAYPDAPVEIETADLVSAARFVEDSEPSLTVECFFAGFDGVYAVERSAAGRAF